MTCVIVSAVVFEKTRGPELPVEPICCKGVTVSENLELSAGDLIQAFQMTTTQMDPAEAKGRRYWLPETKEVLDEEAARPQ